jgi:hypothetical protein
MVTMKMTTTTMTTVMEYERRERIVSYRFVLERSIGCRSHDDGDACGSSGGGDDEDDDGGAR